MATPSIALCMVVRNEAQFVRAAVESAAPVVDEVVVVDTGSHDGTPDIARDAGARVHELPWPGDLARAHDLPVDLARAAWALVLDGDEVLDPAARDRLRDTAASGGADAYRFTVRNYAFRPHLRWRGVDPRDPLARGGRGWTPSRAVRLYRRQPDIRHRGRVHQSVAGDILARGGRVADTDIPIHHYGHIRVDRERGPLYLHLARQQARDTPDDPWAWLDYGLVLKEMRDPAQALYAFRRAHERGAPADAAFAAARALLEMERPEPALAMIEEAIAGYRPEAARYDLADAHEEKAGILEALGRPAAAEAACREAMRLRPDSPQALNNLAGLLAERGALDQALAQAEALVRRYPGLEMPWATLGTVRLRRGEWDAARRALETALDIRPWLAEARLNLVLCHHRAGREREARRAWQALLANHGPRELSRVGVDAEASRAGAPPVVPAGDAPLVVSVIPHLAGGGGRVCVDVVRALHGHARQLVLTGDGGGLHRQGLVEELRELGVALTILEERDDVRQQVAALTPALVVAHWWSPAPGKPARSAREPWVCVGHSALPMPAGYDGYVVISDFHARLQRHLPAARLVRIDNAVDLERFAPAAHGPRETVTIVAVARLDPEKFPRRFLDALPPLVALGARVLVAGRGPRRYEIEPELAERGLTGAVRFLGNVPTQEVPALLRSADIGLHLTETHEEILSLTLLEMLAAGLPIVTQPRGCVTELVEDGVNGLLVRDDAETAAALTRLSRSAEERARMGTASRARAARYDFGRYRQAWLTLLQRASAEPCRLAAPAAAAGTPRRVDPYVMPARAATECGGDTARLCYLVAATPRSGSSLLCEALSATGLAGAPREHLAPGPRRTAALALEDDDPARFVRAMVEEFAGPNEVFGTKLLWPQFADLCRSLDAAGPPGGPRLLAALRALLPGLRLVRLRRRDRVRQAISLWRAEQTGQWASTHRGGATAPVFDREAIAARLHRIDTQERGWEDFLAAHDLAPLRVDYEDLAADVEGTALDVLDRLGIERPTQLNFPPLRLKRQADALTERWVSRWYDAPA